jgi:hypothetical protein
MGRRKLIQLSCFVCFDGLTLSSVVVDFKYLMVLMLIELFTVILDWRVHPKFHPTGCDGQILFIHQCT